jgi:hypothetical protein
VANVLNHLRALWGTWWPLPGGFFLAFCTILALAGELRPEHILVTALVSVTAYTNARTKRFLVDMLPYVAIGLGYDLVRYPRDLLLRPENVMACGLRDAELALFPAGSGQTWQDFFAKHHHVAADLLAAIPYSIFIYFAFAYAAYLFFVDRPRMRYFLWALAIGNYLSFVMWLVVPAAPPWYIRAHGCEIDLATLPNPAGLARVDDFFQINYFHKFYSRSASVFGAMPSMHCAYPVIGLLTAWKSIGWKTRPLHLLYAVWMFAAAVYLDHHWILDAIGGWVVAGVSVLAAGWGLRRVGIWPADADRPSGTSDARVPRQQEAS